MSNDYWRKRRGEEEELQRFAQLLEAQRAREKRKKLTALIADTDRMAGKGYNLPTCKQLKSPILAAIFTAFPGSLLKVK